MPAIGTFRAAQYMPHAIDALLGYTRRFSAAESAASDTRPPGRRTSRVISEDP